MGHVATVLVNMDVVDNAVSDPEFGRKLRDACVSVIRGQPVTVSSGGAGAVATVIDCHHADWYQTILVGLPAIVCKSGTMWQRDDNEDKARVKLRALKALAEELGYRVSKIPAKKGCV